jgi:hypothetical protein
MVVVVEGGNDFSHHITTQTAKGEGQGRTAENFEIGGQQNRAKEEVSLKPPCTEPL